MRVLRFPPADATSERGIGSHTDYGLLVIAAQDDFGGLCIWPPVPGEERGRNWLPDESMAGRYEHDEPWTFVTPVPAVFTVFPGDITSMFRRCHPERVTTARIEAEGRLKILDRLREDALRAA
jgi:isopenicillin N synthase-like dioxygenase